MIIYFSGTGNTRYAAQALGEMLDHEVKDIKELIHQHRRIKFYSQAPYIICAPIYAWRYPPLVESFLENSDFWGSNKMYFVATCASSTGNAAKYLKKICEKKGMVFMGFAGVPMPENYTVMFTPPSKEEQDGIFRLANTQLTHVANTVIRGEVLTNALENKLTKPLTAVINPWFYGTFVSSRKFTTTDKCVGCGACVDACPYESIKLFSGRPVWGTKCTHCMACLNGCPTGAIEYGRSTKGKERYFCRRRPKIVMK